MSQFYFLWFLSSSNAVIITGVQLYIVLNAIRNNHQRKMCYNAKHSLVGMSRSLVVCPTPENSCYTKAGSQYESDHKNRVSLKLWGCHSCRKQYFVSHFTIYFVPCVRLSIFICILFLYRYKTLYSLQNLIGRCKNRKKLFQKIFRSRRKLVKSVINLSYILQVRISNIVPKAECPDSEFS